MPADASESSATPVPVPTGPAAAPVSAPPPPSGSPAAPAASAPVQATVETVVRLVEAQANRDLQTVSAVNLNFQVGGDELAVRVEWRGGEVHAEFRTDSADLRAALASQWQATAPASSAAVHFAPPVFSSGGSAGGDAAAFAGNGQPRPQQPAPDLPAGARSPRMPAAPPSAAPDPLSAASAPPGALRLHTFA